MFLNFHMYLVDITVDYYHENLLIALVLSKFPVTFSIKVEVVGCLLLWLRHYSLQRIGCSVFTLFLILISKKLWSGTRKLLRHGCLCSKSSF